MRFNLGSIEYTNLHCNETNETNETTVLTANWEISNSFHGKGQETKFEA